MRQQLATYLDKLSQINLKIKERTGDLIAARNEVIRELENSGIDYERVLTSPTQRRCAASGLPLLDGDEVLWDDETQETVLRCLVLPPRPAEESECDCGGAHHASEAA